MRLSTHDFAINAFAAPLDIFATHLFAPVLYGVRRHSGAAALSHSITLSYPRVPNLGVIIESSSDLANWTPWNIAGNQLFFAATAGTTSLTGPASDLAQFFRAWFVLP